MKNQKIVSYAFVFLFIFSQTISGRLLLENKKGKEDEVKLGNDNTSAAAGKSEYTDSLEELMGLEVCENRDEECMRRRFLATAHLDYIYTQNKKNP